MNNFEAVITIGWQTRNSRRHQKAITWCKDYGLNPILSNLSIGKLYPKEEREISNKFKKEFTRKTEKVFFSRICQSCYDDMKIDNVTKEKLDYSSNFELIQIPMDLDQNKRNIKKHNK